MFEAKDAAHMPADWTSVALGEVASCTLGGTPSTEIPQFWGGSIPWMASGDVHLRRIDDVPGRITAAGLASSNATLVSPPAVAIGLAGQGKTRGTVALTLCELATNQSIALVRGDPSRLQTEYLFHALDRRYEELRARSSGGGRGGLSKGILDSVPIDLPPLAEQEVITAVLDTLDTTIRQTEAIIAKLKQVKQGLLHDLLTRGIAANGELRPPQSEAPHLYKASPLGWIPVEWQLTPADQACEAVIDCKNRTPPEAASGHPVIRTPNIRDGRFVREGLAYTDSLSYAIWTQRGQPRKGDVLITREAPVGEVCLLPEDMADGCLGQRMMMYRPEPSVLSSEFMLIALLSAPVQKSLLDLAGGSTVGHVKVGDIRTLRIPVPSLDEQERIVRAYGSSEARLMSEQALSTKLQKQKSGLMDDLLTGRVRVTPLLAQAPATQP